MFGDSYLPVFRLDLPMNDVNLAQSRRYDTLTCCRLPYLFNTSVDETTEAKGVRALPEPSPGHPMWHPEDEV